MYQPADFENQMILVAKKNATYPTLAPELEAIAAALAADTTTRDLTLVKPVPALKPGADQTPFANEVLLLVNRARGGNLTGAEMGSIIDGALGSLGAPTIAIPPTVTGVGAVGQILTSTSGNWNYAPTSYAYQWLRNGAARPGGITTPTLTLTAADSGTSLSCRVTAFNAAGQAIAVSNAIAVA